MKLALTNLFCTALLLFLSIAGFSQASNGVQMPGSRTAGDITLVSTNYPSMALINGVYQNDGYYGTRAANQIMPIALSGNILNSGTTDQTNVRLLAQVTESLGTIIFDGVDSISELLTGSNTLIEIPDYFMPNGVGDFTLSMWCDQAEGDTFPADNYADDVTININDNHVIARHKDYNDQFNPSAYGMPSGSFVGINFYIAQFDEISTISVFIDSLSPSGAGLIAYLYENNNGSLIYMAMSEAYQVLPSDVGNWVHLNLVTIDPTDDSLDGEASYVAGVEMYTNANGLIIGSDSQGLHDYNIEIQAFGNTTPIDQIPMIEVHLDGYLQLAEETIESKVNVYPNPASSSLNIETEFVMNKAEIYSISGELIKAFVETSNRLSLDISFLPTGTYFVKLSGEDKVAVQRFIKL